jgi:hypothetical protein
MAPTKKETLKASAVTNVPLQNSKSTATVVTHGMYCMPRHFVVQANP